MRKSAKKIVKDAKKAEKDGPASDTFPSLDNLTGLDAFNPSSKSVVEAKTYHSNQFDFSVASDKDSMFHNTTFAAFSDPTVGGQEKQERSAEKDPFAKKK